MSQALIRRRGNGAREFANLQVFASFDINEMSLISKVLQPCLALSKILLILRVFVPTLSLELVYLLCLHFIVCLRLDKVLNDKRLK